MVLSASLALPSRQILPALIALLGVWLTGSRAGFGASLVVLVVAVVFAGRGKILYRTAASAAVACTMFAGASLLIVAACKVGDAPTTTPWCGYLGYAHYAQESSNSEHLLSSIGGLQMFLEHPIFGAGLGAFIHDSAATGPRPFDHPLDADLAACRIWRGRCSDIRLAHCCNRHREIKRFRNNDTVGRLLLLAIAAFATMSLAHELMYQRTFWLLFGAALAIPYLKVATVSVGGARLNQASLSSEISRPIPSIGDSVPLNGASV